MPELRRLAQAEKSRSPRYAAAFDTPALLMFCQAWLTYSFRRHLNVCLVVAFGTLLTRHRRQHMDPFADVLADAERQLETAQVQLRQYQNEASPGVLTNLNHTIQELTETIHDLSRSIGAVQADPVGFGVDHIEIQNRIKQVGHINTQVSDIQEALAAARRTRPDLEAWRDHPLTGETPEEIEAEAEILLQEAIDQQDIVLDSVYNTVSTLRQQATVMTRELEDQAVLLEDFETHVDSTNDRIRMGLKRVDWVLRHNREKLSSCCITLLIITLVVLLVLVILA